MAKAFDVNYREDVEKIYSTVVKKTRDYLEKHGFTKAVLGLSGGLDSAVCAVILSEILDPKNVYGIFMPCTITTSQSRVDAEEIAQNLGINYFEIPVNSIVEEFTKVTIPLFKNADKSGVKRAQNSYTLDNFQARSRANIIWSLANEFQNMIPIATSDKSESYMGYTTVNGDMSGGFCPIADVLKTQLFAIVKYLNAVGVRINGELKKNVIPYSTATKPPCAELAIDPNTNAPLNAESALMPYPFMDEVIFRLEVLGQNFTQMMDSKFVFEDSCAISKEQKRAWLDKFIKIVEGAVFKWSLMPEIAVVDENSLNRKECIEELKALFN